MGLRKVTALVALMVVAGACQVESAEAARIFRFMENKKYNIHDYGKKMPFSTFDKGYYSTRYPFNRYYTQQAHGFHGFHEYNR